MGFSVFLGGRGTLGFGNGCWRGSQGGWSSAQLIWEQEGTTRSPREHWENTWSRNIQYIHKGHSQPEMFFFYLWFTVMGQRILITWHPSLRKPIELGFSKFPQSPQTATRGILRKQEKEKILIHLIHPNSSTVTMSQTLLRLASCHVLCKNCRLPSGGQTMQCQYT